MSESAIAERIQQITAIREQISSDGHFAENAAALIVSIVAPIRELYRDPGDAALGLAVFTSANDRQDLKKAREKKGLGLVPLREMAMKLRYYTGGKGNFVTLGNKVKELTTR